MSESVECLVVCTYVLYNELLFKNFYFFALSALIDFLLLLSLTLCCKHICNTLLPFDVLCVWVCVCLCVFVCVFVCVVIGERVRLVVWICVSR